MGTWGSSFFKGLANTPLFNKRVKAPEAQPPLPEICEKIKVGRIDGKRLFSGGEKTDWEKVANHVGNWKTILIDYDVIKDLPVERVANNFTKKIAAGLIHSPEMLKTFKNSYGQYDELLENSTFASSSDPYYTGDAPAGFSEEEVWMWSKYNREIINRYMSSDSIDNDAAEEEIEVLKLGGLILGAYKSKILVYFPFLTESVMAKILTEDKKPTVDHFSTQHFGSTFVTGSGSYFGASGSAGQGGGGAMPFIISPPPGNISPSIIVGSPGVIKKYNQILKGATS
ncbi:MAG: hypothetical protein KCHDKBKB_00746 [Elusimicrobia bacterium]|nr:hypothetical protein [Elusimicrobiota bacterium]